MVYSSLVNNLVVLFNREKLYRGFFCKTQTANKFVCRIYLCIYYFVNHFVCQLNAELNTAAGQIKKTKNTHTRKTASTLTVLLRLSNLQRHRHPLALLFIYSFLQWSKYIQTDKKVSLAESRQQLLAQIKIEILLIMEKYHFQYLVWSL